MKKPIVSKKGKALNTQLVRKSPSGRIQPTPEPGSARSFRKMIRAKRKWENGKEVIPKRTKVLQREVK